MVGDCAHVRDRVGNLLNSRPRFLEEPTDGGVGTQGREHLDARPGLAEGEHRLLDPLFLVDLSVRYRQTEHAPVVVDRLVEIVDRDTDVIDCPKPGLHVRHRGIRGRALHDGGVDSVDSLAAGVRAGGVREIARAISAIENSPIGAPDLLDALGAPTSPAHVIGVTGAPGVGKSTMTSALVRAFRMRGSRVAVIAVDPSSPFSGGALLGDRIRMQEHSGDTGVYIRSMASRGHLGGLAAAIGPVLRVCEVAGFDVVILETVGVGQSEVEVAAAADTTLVLVAPGMGDGIQAAKAGILEIGDIFVVNKADRDGAATTARELRHMIALGERPPQEWEPPVNLTVASTGDGVNEVVEATDRHRAWLVETGALTRRRELRAREEILDTASALTRARLLENRPGVEALAAEVAAGQRTAFEAARSLVAD